MFKIGSNHVSGSDFTDTQCHFYTVV